MIKRTLTAVYISAGMFAASIAQAGIIWDNRASNPNNLGASFSEENSGQVADDFSLSTSATLRSVQFWGVHWNTGVEPAAESFTAYVYSDSLDAVGSLVGSSSLDLISKVDTGFDHNNQSGANILDFTMDLTNPILLNSGDYWFSVVSADNPTTTFAWQQSGEDGTGNSRVTVDDWRTQHNARSSAAFNLSNNFAATRVAEPSTIALLGLGLAGLGFRTRHRKT